MKQHLLSESLVCADETTMQVLDEPDRAATSKSYMWVYRSGEFAPNPVVIYDYQPSRAQTCPKGFLGDYSGYLLCDGYKPYEGLKSVTLAGCMVHARRKFTDAQKAQPKAKPILAEFHSWLEDSQEKVLPKSLIGKAINYTLNQWDKLTTYLEDGNISIDNNVTERDIRPFTTGRKNWLFSKSVAGEEASANLYGIVMTCRANDINPYYYFLHLFRMLPTRVPGADLSDLLPWNIDFSEAE